MKIRESFSSSEPCNMAHPPFDPNKFTVFTQVTQDEIRKIMNTSLTKSCPLDPLPTFLIKECTNILLPSINKLVNCSLQASVLPLMLPLFEIHFLKIFLHHTFLPLLERSSKPKSTQRHIPLSPFYLMPSPWC